MSLRFSAGLFSLVLCLALPFSFFLFYSIEERRNVEDALFRSSERVMRVLLPFLEPGTVQDPGELCVLLQQTVWKEDLLYAALTNAEGQVRASSFGFAGSAALYDILRAVAVSKKTSPISEYTLAANKTVLHQVIVLPDGAGFLQIGTMWRPLPIPYVLGFGLAFLAYFLLCWIFGTVPWRGRSVLNTNSVRLDATATQGGKDVGSCENLYCTQKQTAVQTLLRTDFSNPLSVNTSGLVVPESDQTGCALLLLDEHGKILSCNAELLRFLNFPMPIEGKYWTDEYLRAFCQKSVAQEEHQEFPSLFAIDLSKLEAPCFSCFVLPDCTKERVCLGFLCPLLLHGRRFTMVCLETNEASWNSWCQFQQDLAGKEHCFSEENKLSGECSQLELENSGRKVVIQSLRRAESRYRGIFDNVIEGIVQWTPDGRLIWANMPFARMFGFSTVNALMHHFRQRKFHFCSEKVNEESLVKHLDTIGYVFDFENQTSVGNDILLWVSINARKVKENNGKLVYYEAFVLNIAERKEIEKKLYFQAFHDPLTGLANRALFRDRLSMALRRIARSSESFAVCFLDLDRFKHVNDVYGHQTGDLLLQHVATTLLAVVRESDTVARFGGDEFGIILETFSGEEAVHEVTRRICGSLSVPVILNGVEVSVGVSIGVVVHAERYAAIDAILKDADTAMYQAKASDGEHVHIVCPAR